MPRRISYLFVLILSSFFDSVNRQPFSKPRHIVLVIVIFHLRLPFISFVFIIAVRLFIDLTTLFQFCHAFPKRLVIRLCRIFIIVGTVHLYGSQQLLQFRDSPSAKHLHFPFPCHFRLCSMLADVLFQRRIQSTASRICILGSNIVSYRFVSFFLSITQMERKGNSPCKAGSCGSTAAGFVDASQ